MLTNFFGKSNPVNYLIVGFFIIVAYIIAIVANTISVLSILDIVEHAIFLVLILASLLLFDFVIRKNSLTQQNTYALYFFGCFICMLPVIFLSRYYFISNVFLLLALRRIMSLRADVNSEKKILDASIWITFASFFNFWSLLYFAVLTIAVFRKPNPHFKQLLIPAIGFFAVLSIATAFHYVTHGTFQWFLNWHQPISFDFSAYNSSQLLLPVSVIGAFLIWTAFHRITNIAAIQLKERPNYMLMLLILCCSILITLLTPNKTGAELLFILAPLAIMVSNYLETLKATDKNIRRIEFWFKETLLWLVFALAVSMLVFY